MKRPLFSFRGIVSSLLVSSISFLAACQKKGASPAYTEADYAYAPAENPGGPKFNSIQENPFLKASRLPLSTFSVDADGASYSFVRRMISNGSRGALPADAVRTEELVNYFAYDYPAPADGEPIRVSSEMSACPWAEGHKLVSIGIQGKALSWERLPAANLVFLVDVSGSMGADDKLGLVKNALNLLAERLRPQDRVSIVTYAGNSGVALAPTPGNRKDAILAGIARMASGGSTNGADGIRTAYELAQENFVRDGNNRVILCTDGDFNVGISSQEALIQMIEEKRKTGVFLSVLGVGADNLNDGMMEQLADHGNGNYNYLDEEEEAHKVFEWDFGTLCAVAKDVKVQVAFDTAAVEAYRLIGYENRALSNEAFADDSTDAGEIGAGQTVVALYEIVPRAGRAGACTPLRMDFRYKQPDGSTSQLIRHECVDEGKTFEKASERHRFAASVAAFSLLLRHSEHAGTATFAQVEKWASQAKGYDPHGLRAEFVELINKAQ